MLPPVLAGKYQLVSVLGQGGMGTVWRAEHLGLGAPVAVKLMEPKAAGGPDAWGLCQKEARAAAALRSPHVVQVLDVGMDDRTGSPFIVMELLEGENLAERLRRLGKLSPDEAVRAVIHVARALSRAHEAGIIHRDLKPSNIFLVRNEDDEIAKVLDFGTARDPARCTVGRGHHRETGAVIGTPYYMSPEHISGLRVDHRTDLWALAVMAFECLVGRRPFDAPEIGGLVLQICTYPIPIPTQVARVPSRLDAWFRRATAREVDRRFQSARDLAYELRRACGVGPPEKVSERSRSVGARTLELPPATAPIRVASIRPRGSRWIFVAAAFGLGLAAAALSLRRAVPREVEVTVIAPAAPSSARPSEAPKTHEPQGPPPAPSGSPPDQTIAAAPKPVMRPVRQKPAPPPAPVALEAPVPPMESVLDHRR